MTAPTALQQRSALAKHITLALYGALLLAVAYDHLVLRDNFFWPVWLLQTAPLLVVLPGLLKSTSRSGIWLCFISMLYVWMFLDHAATAQHRTAYVLSAILVLALFISAMLFSRWQKQAHRDAI